MVAMSGLFGIRDSLIFLIFKNWLKRILKIKEKKGLSPEEFPE